MEIIDYQVLLYSSIVLENHPIRFSCFLWNYRNTFYRSDRFFSQCGLLPPGPFLWLYFQSVLWHTHSFLGSHPSMLLWYVETLYAPLDSILMYREESGRLVFLPRFHPQVFEGLLWKYNDGMSYYHHCRLTSASKCCWDIDTAHNFATTILLSHRQIRLYPYWCRCSHRRGFPVNHKWCEE